MRPICHSIRAATIAGLALGQPALAMADIYQIDKDHTEVRFTWDHVGMSRQGGRFRDVSGTLDFDPVNPGASSVDIRIKVASVSTGVAKLDDQLVRSGEFFDAQSHPNITFKSTSVAPAANRTAQVTGNLTVNGVTKPVVLNVRWNFTGEHPLAPINPVYKETFASGFSATTQLLRSDFGISRTIPFVSDEIRITIETEFHRTKVTTPQAGLTPDAGPAPAGTQTGGLPPAAPRLEVPESPPLPPVDGSAPHATQLPPLQDGTPPSGDAPATYEDATPPPGDGAAAGPGSTSGNTGDDGALPPLDPAERLDN